MTEYFFSFISSKVTIGPFYYINKSLPRHLNCKSVETYFVNKTCLTSFFSYKQMIEGCYRNDIIRQEANWNFLRNKVETIWSWNFLSFTNFIIKRVFLVMQFNCLSREFSMHVYSSFVTQQLIYRFWMKLKYVLVFN